MAQIGGKKDRGQETRKDIVSAPYLVWGDMRGQEI